MQAPEPPPATSSRRGLRLRHVKGGTQSFYDVEHPGELERVRPELTRAKYDAGITLRRLWASGTINPEATSSSTSRLEYGAVSRSAGDSGLLPGSRRGRHIVVGG
jgi:hypothetical protein